MFLPNGEPSCLNVLHSHVIQTQTELLFLFLMDGMEWRQGDVNIGMGPNLEGQTSLSLYQVRLSAVRINQYSRELPLMSETGMLSQPFLMIWKTGPRAVFSR